MKGVFIPMLAVVFSMLALPMISLKNAENEAVIDIFASKQTEAYIQEEANLKKDETIKVLKDEKILEISMEDYLFGVVAAEMPALYEVEALKAQAVSAYTFACYKKAENDNKEYDISADYKTAQGFITRKEAKSKWGEKADEYEKKINTCIKQVSGELLTFEGKPIFAAYHAISSGVTNSARDVFGKEISYLVPQNSASDKLAKGYLSEAEFTSEEIAEKMQKYTKAKGKAKNYFTEIKATDNGYVKSLNFCDVTLSGSQISEALGLRSANFKISFANDKFKFTVKGYGHGVGMSQNGANYMAQQGKGYEEILLHYYENAVLQKN